MSRSLKADEYNQKHYKKLLKKFEIYEDLNLDCKKLKEYILVDKKNSDTINFVMLKEKGQPFIKKILKVDLDEFLDVFV